MERNQSEVAHLLNQIETEYLAAQRGLTGFAESAKHAAITARMENVGRLHENLHALVGKDAIRLLAEHLESIPEEETKRAGQRTDKRRERTHNPTASGANPDLRSAHRPMERSKRAILDLDG